MKLQHYAPDFMETFNPTDTGFGARVVKEPVDETTYRLVVDAWCKTFGCLTPTIAIKQSFNDYVNGKVSAAPPKLPKPQAKPRNPQAR